MCSRSSVLHIGCSVDVMGRSCWTAAGCRIVIATLTRLALENVRTLNMHFHQLLLHSRHFAQHTSGHRWPNQATQQK